MRRDARPVRETTWLLERYVPGRQVSELRRLVRRLRTAVAEGATEEEPIRVVQVTIVPRDASLLCLVSARSEAAIQAALEGAGIAVDRISMAIVDDAVSPTAEP